MLCTYKTQVGEVENMAQGKAKCSVNLKTLTVHEALFFTSGALIDNPVISYFRIMMVMENLKKNLMF